MSVNSTNSQIKSFMPELQILSKDEALTLFSSNHEVKEGKIYKNGELLKDDMQNPLSIDKAVQGFLTERNFIKTNEGNQGGRGTGNGGAGNPPSTLNINNMQEFYAHCDKNNINVKSQEAVSILKDIREKNKNFKFN